jgi:hypothetical protein
MTVVVALFAIGFVSLSLECLGVAVACFGIAALILRFAS